jgi:hypothetical protein
MNEYNKLSINRESNFNFQIDPLPVEELLSGIGDPELVGEYEPGELPIPTDYRKYRNFAVEFRGEVNNLDQNFEAARWGMTIVNREGKTSPRNKSFGNRPSGQPGFRYMVIGAVDTDSRSLLFHVVYYLYPSDVCYIYESGYTNPVHTTKIGIDDGSSFTSNWGNSPQYYISMSLPNQVNWTFLE